MHKNAQVRNAHKMCKCTKMRKFGNGHRATFGLGKLSKVCTQSRESFSPRALRRLDPGHETVQTLGRSIALRNCVVSDDDDDDDDAIGTVLFQTKITQTILNSNKKHKNRSERKCWPSTAGHRTVSKRTTMSECQSHVHHQCSAHHEMHRRMLLNQC